MAAPWDESALSHPGVHRPQRPRCVARLSRDPRQSGGNAPMGGDGGGCPLRRSHQLPTAFWIQKRNERIMARKSPTAVALAPVSPETMEVLAAKFPELRPVMGAPLVPETQGLEEAFTVEICRLKEFQVTDQMTCGQAAIHLANVKAWKRNAEGIFERFCEVFNYVHKWGTSRQSARRCLRRC